MSNTDLSIEFYDKYYSLKNCEIEITLKNDSTIKGKIIGFINNDFETDIPQIVKWHVVRTNNISEDIDDYDTMEGRFVNQSDIKKVHFYEDQSNMSF